MNNEEYVSLCGLYCLDCIPSQNKLFETANELQELLVQLKFDEYAKLKSVNNTAFRDYSTFQKVLEEIIKLKCPAPCRLGGGKPECKVKACVQSHPYSGCWECGNYKSCELLLALKKVHTNLENHLELIQNEGINNFISKRGKHYSWE
jgi:hypothetical protein